MYLRLCCCIVTIASGESNTTAGIVGGLTSGSGFCQVSIHGNSLALSDEFVVPLLVRGLR